MRKSTRRKKPSEQQHNSPAAVTSIQKAPQEKETRVRYDAKLVTISWEPLYTKRKIMDETKKEIIDFYFDFQKKPDETISRIKGVLEKLPDLPILYAYLFYSYSFLGETSQASTYLSSAIEKFPEILWGKIFKAEQAILKTDWTQIPNIFNPEMDYRKLYDKDNFHVLEDIAFHYIAVRYYSAVQNKDKSTYHLEELRKMDPKQRFIKELETTKVVPKQKFSFLRNALNKIRGKS